MGPTLESEVQEQIDRTIAHVLGDRKKYMSKLKDFQTTFYEKLTVLSAEVKRGGAVELPVELADPAPIPHDAADTDSDKSLDRMAGFLDQLKDEGRLELGGGKGDVTNADVAAMLKRHNDEKLEAVRGRFAARIPIRRQAMYREDLKNGSAFAQTATSKLRVLAGKQVEAVARLGVYKHLSIANQRRQSGSLSQSSKLRSQGSRSSKLSVNAGARLGSGRRDGGEAPGSPGVPALGRRLTKKLTQGKVLEKEFELRLMEKNKDAVALAMNNLRNKYRVKVAAELASELARQNAKVDIRLFKVKEKTLTNAVLAYKESPENQMTPLQVGSVVQLLSLEHVVDDKGDKVETDFVERTRPILASLVAYEAKQQEHNESSDDSSQASRVEDRRLKPPVIETQLATDRSRRSKTMLPSSSSRIGPAHRSHSGTSYSDDSGDGSAKQAQTGKDDLKDLKSVKDSESRTSG